MPERQPNRRTLLKTVGVAGSLSALGTGVFGRSADAQQQSGAWTAREEGFETVVNIVEAGASNAGSQSINAVLRRVSGNDTLVKFPPGTYLLTDTFRLTGFQNFGMIGQNATIRIGPTRGFSESPAFKLGVPEAPGNGLLVENLVFDQRGTNRGQRAIQSSMTDGLRIRDILVRGQHDTVAESGGTFNIVDPNGRGTVERFQFPDGTLPIRTETGDRVQPGRSGITTNVNHVGTLWYKDCTVVSCHDNGMYVRGGGRSQNGTVVVQGGLYRNNNVSNIRIGGANSAIEDVQVVVDQNEVEFLNQRGIRLDDGANVVVNNAEIRLPQPNGDAISVLNEVGAATIVDTNIHLGDRAARGINVSAQAGPLRVIDTTINTTGPDEGGAAIFLAGGSTSNHTPVTIENSSVTGNASGATGSREAVIVQRDNATFRNVTIDQPGRALRQGINISGRNCNVVDCNIQARHHPIVARGPNLQVRNSQLQSYGGYHAIRFYAGSSGQVLDNVLQRGIQDSGASSLLQRGNQYI
ncbi:hypothetical protein ACNS7O_11515 [Haloferacaceae archaeon DSL9]